MRISDSMFHDLLVRGAGDSRQAYFEAQQVASTGMKVDKPSDDPVAASLARAAKSREERSQVVVEQSDEAFDDLHQADSILANVGDVVSRARELAVAGANDHLSASDRAAMASEVNALRAQVLSLANSRVDGEYVFSGLAVDRAPFDASGAFVGDSSVRELDVGPGLRLATQLSGEDIFSPTAGVNVFEVLDDLEIALNSDDAGAVHNMLGDVEAAVGQIAQGRSRAGSAQIAWRQARAAAEQVREHSITRRSTLTEADPVEAFTELIRAEGALREAISLAARLPPPSLAEIGG